MPTRQTAKQAHRHWVEESITDCNGLAGSEGTLKKNRVSFEVPRTVAETDTPSRLYRQWWSWCVFKSLRPVRSPILLLLLLLWTNMIKVSYLLELQEHFTIKRTRSESSMIQRTSKAEHNRHVRTKTSQEKLWFETPPEDSQWRRRSDARRQTVPYARSHDRKCAITNGRVQHRRYNEYRRI